MTWRLLRASTYWTLGALFASGIAWFVLHRWFPVAGEFGPQPNPAEPWLLRLHGAAATASLVVLGALLPSHVLPSWRRGRNRASGLGLAGVALALIVTGYLLYYSGNEAARAVASWMHVGLGVALPGVLLLHALAALRLRRHRRDAIRGRRPAPAG